MKRTLVASFLALLTGCASVTPTYQTETAYAIFDVQPASINREAFLQGITKAVQRNSTQVTVSRGIPPADLPAQPGRFEIKDPFGNSNMGALLAASGKSVKVPVCEDSIMTISSGNTFMAEQGENTSFFLCVLPYQKGYHIDIYATFSRLSGGLSGEALGTALARSVIGESSQFIPRTINDVKAAAESVGGRVTIVDSHIPESFKGAFVNQADSLRN